MGNHLYSTEVPVEQAPPCAPQETKQLVTTKVSVRPLTPKKEEFIDELKRVLIEREKKKNSTKDDTVSEKEEMKKFHEMLLNMQISLKNERMLLDEERKQFALEKKQFESEHKTTVEDNTEDSIIILPSDVISIHFGKYTDDIELLKTIVEHTNEKRQLQYTCCVNYKDDYNNIVNTLKQVCDNVVCVSNTNELINCKNTLVVYNVAKELDKNDVTNIEKYKDHITQTTGEFTNLLFITDNPVYLIDVTMNEQDKNNSFIRHIEFVSNE